MKQADADKRELILKEEEREGWRGKEETLFLAGGCVGATWGVHRTIRITFVLFRPQQLSATKEAPKCLLFLLLGPHLREKGAVGSQAQHPVYWG